MSVLVQGDRCFSLSNNVASRIDQLRENRQCLIFIRQTDKVYITDPLEEDLVAGGGQFVTYPEVTKDKARAHNEVLLHRSVRLLVQGDRCFSLSNNVASRIDQLRENTHC